MEGGGASTAAPAQQTVSEELRKILDQCAQVNPEKTLAQMLQVKEANLAREALAERRALRLTKYYLHENEAEQQEKLRKMAEKSRMQYQNGMQSLRDKELGEASKAEMVREEKKVLLDLAKAYSAKHREFEAQGDAKRHERSRWAHARQCYDKVATDKRNKKFEESQKERKERLEEKIREHEKALKAASEEKEASRDAACAKAAADTEKAAINRRAQIIEARKNLVETRRENLAKQEEAQRRRQEREHEVLNGLQKRCEQREKKVVQMTLKVSKDAEEKRKRLLAKYDVMNELACYKEEKSKIRAEEEHRRVFLDSTSSAQLASTQNGSTPEQDVLKATPKIEERPSRSHVTCWSKEVVDANNRAQKDYIQKCSDLQQAASQMLTQKNFKSLADEASKMESKDDAQTRHMKWLHSRIVAEKSKQSKDTMATLSIGGGGFDGITASSGSMTDRGSRRRLVQCGLCERDFTTDAIVGSALRRVINVFRRGGPQQDEKSTQSDKAGHVDLPETLEGASTRSTVQSPLYDYALPLCTACHRIVTLRRP
eukprot:TRINITY_DN29352_c0_g1_i1.p1 TRINITY_DN29352_c0_g1~~TRINITY_DN29352_c0_g1_i1.p1  ORF type:complete len:544 (+),score=115.48 TRINITY_DN29352_c0_g1_i1:229-1860(+)